MNKKMVITAVCLLAMSAMMAQNITGKVVDTKGEPLPFANVMLLNRADSAFVKGAVSGEDGSFTINASCNGGIIKVPSVGYTTVFPLNPFRYRWHRCIDICRGDGGKKKGHAFLGACPFVCVV